MAEELNEDDFHAEDFSTATEFEAFIAQIQGKTGKKILESLIYFCSHRRLHQEIWPSGHGS